LFPINYSAAPTLLVAKFVQFLQPMLDHAVVWTHAQSPLKLLNRALKVMIYDRT
jgi:hypothetical protein